MNHKIDLITKFDYVYIRLRDGATRINIKDLVSLTIDEQGNIIGFCRKGAE